MVTLKFSQLPPGWGGGNLFRFVVPFPNDVNKFLLKIYYVNRTIRDMHAKFGLDATVVSEKGGYRPTDMCTHIGMLQFYYVVELLN